MARKNTGPAPSGDDEVVTRGYGDGRYVRNLGGVTSTVVGTQAQYDALATKDGGTLYVIVG